MPAAEAEQARATPPPPAAEAGQANMPPPVEGRLHMSIANVVVELAAANARLAMLQDP